MDGTAAIVAREADGDSLRLRFKVKDAGLLRFLVVKGYVTLDGASLTVTEVDDKAQTFGVMLIQHTQEKITLGRKAEGATVNVEVDMVGKYVLKSVEAALGGGDGEQGLRGLIEKVVVDVLSKNKAT